VRAFRQVGSGRTAEGRSRAKAPRKANGAATFLTPAQQKEATRRRAQGAKLQELADSYDRSNIHHAPRDPRRVNY